MNKSPVYNIKAVPVEKLLQMIIILIQSHHQK